MNRKFLALFAAGLFALPLVAGTPEVPTFDAVHGAWRPSDARLLDRRGEVVHEVRIDPVGRRLAWTPLAEVSPALLSAVIASEDRRFASHRGVDFRALAAAAWQRLRGGRSRGASTISMQVAALVAGESPATAGPRTAAQKWRQIRLARALERSWSKEEILEAYVNLVTFRGELQGVAAAAGVLLGRAPHGIDAAEAAVLGSLIRSPNATRGTLERRANALAARLGLPIGNGEITAVVARMVDSPTRSGPRITLAPHAARRVLAPTPDAVTVRTTLDARLQRVAAEALHRQLLAVGDRSVRDGAVLVADNATGEVLAYVGGSRELSSARHVDGIRARRQAGSALKPFLYGLALEWRLLTPASLLEDAPLEIAVAGGLYEPRNYDERFGGLVTLRTALASSLNVPAVRTLGLVGDEAFVTQLRRLGFEGVREAGDYYGPSLALGSADVSLWELVGAYRALAAGGLWSPLRLAAGDGLATPRRVFTPETAFLVADILADRESRSATFGLENPLATRFWSAVKTGTSKEMRDNWCVGFSRRYTVGAWVGNFSGQPMHDVSGITGAAPVWLEVMERLHRDEPSPPPEPAGEVVLVRASFPDSAGGGRSEWFRKGTEPGEGEQPVIASASRIAAPVAESIVALDPDIPSGHQRIAFAAVGGRELFFMLDGEPLGPADASVLWEPLPGRHTLALMDGEGRIVDSVSFRVRGSRRAP